MAGLHYNCPIVLASKSEPRRKLLEGARLTFEVQPCHVREEEIKSEYPGLSPQELSAVLAREKARAVSEIRPDCLVIGADQICELGGEILSKPGDRETAIRHLRKMNTKTHHLHTSVALLMNDHCLWEYTETASLRMLCLKDSAIEAYVDQDKPFAAAGGYRFESMGRHLFAEARGSTECILGLPLTPLICALHDMGFIEYRAATTEEKAERSRRARQG
jgi:septum formation protein